MNMLNTLWHRQRMYNQMIQELEGTEDPHFWSEKYILGLVSEMDEILRDIRWKRHRKNSGRPVDLTNLGYELADVMKYAISLWQIWGFGVQDMLDYCLEKTDILEVKLQQEFEEIPTDRPILLTDIDGTIGDWRSSFIEWANAHHEQAITDDPATSLLLDADLSMRYVDYYRMKEQFESEGGYRTIKPYVDGIKTVRNLAKECGAYVIVNTARPAHDYHRIWGDTWTWLKTHQIRADQLLIQAEPRILLAAELNGWGNVIMFEDDPGLALRAANSEIRVFMRRQPYNESIEHRNIRVVSRYTEIEINDYFEGSKV